jgi:hypothetical protein
MNIRPINALVLPLGRMAIVIIPNYRVYKKVIIFILNSPTASNEWMHKNTRLLLMGQNNSKRYFKLNNL